MLKEQIVKDRLQAIKDGDSIKKNLLCTIIGELDRVTKEPTDLQVINVVKKMVESNILSKCEEENKYLEVYLPKMLTTSELTEIIKEEVTKQNYLTVKDTGKLMTYLNSNFSGKFDGKQASDIFKSLIQ